MSLIEKYKTLVDALFDKTQAGSLNWQLNGDTEPYVELAGRMITLRSSRNSNGEPVEIVEIANGWEICESFNDDALRMLPEPRPFETYFQKMRTLRHIATRNAKGADEALDSVLDVLKDLR